MSTHCLAEADLEKLSDEAVLRKALDVNVVISTSSSFAQRSRLAVSPEAQCVNQIGEGLQGVIFEQVGHSTVMKKEKPGNEALSSNLRHEYAIHNKVVAAFNTYSRFTKTRVPRPSGIILSSDDAFWNDNLHRFPDGYRSRGTTVMMERILPLPKVIRRALATQFYPRQDGFPPDKTTIDNIFNDTPNKHCLVRTYLGKDEWTYKTQGFSLRNFPLCLNSMDRLGLDVEGLAASMGRAFAILHWGACVDGDDVEFVLGTSAVQSGGNNDDFQDRAIECFLLDFGQCETVDLSSDDSSVVYQAFKGAMVTGDNQLFIPHCQRSPALFGAFRRTYMEAAQVILEDKKLGGKFDAVEFMQQYEEYAEDFLT